MSTLGFLAPFAQVALDVIAPLRIALGSPTELAALLRTQGWVPPDDDSWFAPVSATFALAGDVENVAASLAAVVNGTPSPEELQAALDAASKLLRDLRTSPQPAGLPAPFDRADFWSAFPSDLVATLVMRYLERAHPALFAPLYMLGVLDETPVTPPTGDASRLTYNRSELRWDRLATIVSDPDSLASEVYGWGSGAFDAALLLRRLERSLRALGVLVGRHLPLGPVALHYYPGGSAADLRLLQATLLREQHSAGSVELGAIAMPIPGGLFVGPYVAGAGGTTLSLGGPWTLTLGGGLEAAGVVGVELRPGAMTPRLDGAAATIDLTMGLGLSPSAPLNLIGDPGASRLELQDAALAIELVGPIADPELKLRLSTSALRVIVDLSESDSFLQDVFGSDPQTLSAGGALVWSSKTGFHADGAANLGFHVPLSWRIGPVHFDAIDLALSASGQALEFSAGVTGGASIGPVTVTTTDLGIAFELRSVTAPASGTFGDLALSAGFKPPTGLGLFFASSSIGGGGYVGHDPVTGRYSGALVLTAYGVMVDALGIVDLVDDSYALSAIISSQFPPVELGLGFTLNGVGGLIAINRRIDGDALRTALRGAGIDDIFFTQDPIGHAGRLLGDLGTYFPAAIGRYAFGPAFKLGWGSPTIVEAELAVLLELPAPVRMFLLGSAYTTLPTKDHPLIRLQVDVVGEYDISEKRLAIDATLRDSRVLAFPIVGDFALRASWGSQKCLVISVGGFHSQFRPPPDFPTLRRVRIPIGADKDPRLEITGFLAVTSNTAQIGASVDLYASAGPLNIHGNVGFEALFQFSPFAFTAELSAGVELRRGTTTLASVHLDGTLTGTTPWHVSGEACLSCWLFDLCVPFSAPFGSDAPVELPPTAIWPLVQPVLQDPASWAADLSDGASSVVTTAPPVDATTTAASAAHVEPSAALTVRQKIVPLDRTVTRFAQGTPTDVTQLTVTRATIGTGAVSYTPVTDWFAPAQFEDLSDADRLSRDGFELMDAGVSLGSDAALAGSELINPLAYETIAIPTPPAPPPNPYRPTLLAQLLAGQLGTVELAPQLVATGGLPEDSFVIASADDLTVRGDIIGAGARGLAELALVAHLAAHPEDVGHVIVVPVHELVA